MVDPNIEASRYKTMGELLQESAQGVGNALEQYARHEQTKGKVQDIKNDLDYDVQSTEIGLWLKSEMKKVPGDYDTQRKLAQEAMDKIGAMDFQYTDEIARARFDARKKKDLFTLNYSVEDDIEEQGRRDAGMSFDAKLKQSADLGDIDSYRETVQYGIDSHFITPSEGDLLLQKGTHDITLKNAHNDVFNNPDGLYESLENGKFNDALPAVEQEDLKRRLRAQKEETGANSFFDSFTLQTNAKKKKSEDDAPEFTGLYTLDEVPWIYAVKAGRSGDIENQAKNAAVEEAANYRPISPEDLEKERVKFFDKYSKYGIKDEFLNRQWKVVEDTAKSLVTPTIDLGGILGSLSDRGTMINKSAIDSFKAEYSKNRESYISMYGDAAGVKSGFRSGNDSSETIDKKILDYEEKRHAGETKRQVHERFSTWREYDDEGKKASAFKQEEKLNEIIKSITGNEYLGFTNTSDVIDKEVGKARQIQQNKFKRYSDKQGQKIEIDTRAVENKGQRISLGFDSKNADLPQGVLLPAAMMKDVDPKTDVVEVTFDNKRYRRMRIVGTCEGDAPKMTKAIAREGYYDTKNSYDVIMKIAKGNADSLMKEQEASEASAKKTKKSEKKDIAELSPEDEGLLPVSGDEEEATQVANLSTLLPPLN